MRVKTSLPKATFCIPFFPDSKDRFRNINLLLDYLEFHFCDFKVIIYYTENFQLKGSEENVCNLVSRCSKNSNYIFKDTDGDFITDDGIFHRTACLNAMYGASKTKVVINYDCDILLNPYQYIDAYNLVLRKSTQIVYPYYQKVYKVHPYLLKRIRQFYKYDNIGEIISTRCKYRGEGEFFHLDKKLGLIPNEGCDWDSYGSAVFMGRTAIQYSGGENSNFIGWGAEDHERYYRFKKLNLPIDRTEGSVYHIEHKRNKNCSDKNPYFKRNDEEFDKIKSMNVEELEDYISKGFKE
jgi:hypothetical protein